MYKYVMTFISGAIIGAGGVLLWLRKDYNKKVEEAAAEMERKAIEAKKEAENAKKELEEVKKNADEKLYSELQERLGYTGDAAEVQTRKADTSENNASQGPSGKYYKIGSKLTENIVPPFGISGEDFLLNKKDFSKITLLYYRLDGVLATEDGTEVQDINYVLGKDWMNEVGKYDDGVAYIRNERTGSDYEVIIEDLSYASEFGSEAPD